VKFDDPATGINTKAYTASLMVERKQIADLNLTKIDPIVAFNNLHGKSAGKLVEIDYYRSARLDHKEFFSYNEKGVRNEGVEYTPTGSVLSRNTWVYDDRGNMIETTHDSHDPAAGSFNDTTTFTYEVDSYGNWFRGVTETRDKAGTVISKDALYRTITYF